MVTKRTRKVKMTMIEQSRKRRDLKCVYACFFALDCERSWKMAHQSKKVALVYHVNMQKTANIQALCEEWACMKSEAASLGTYCYMNPTTSEHVPLSHGCMGYGNGEHSRLLYSFTYNGYYRTCEVEPKQFSHTSVTSEQQVIWCEEQNLSLPNSSEAKVAARCCSCKQQIGSTHLQHFSRKWLCQPSLSCHQHKCNSTTSCHTVTITLASIVPTWYQHSYCWVLQTLWAWRPHPAEVPPKWIPSIMHIALHSNSGIERNGLSTGRDCGFERCRWDVVGWGLIP